MQIANRLAGFSLSEADNLRKTVGKKQKDRLAEYRVRFVEGCGKNGIEAERAAELYEEVVRSLWNRLSKSNSVGFVLPAYQAAYLEANYPLEYAAAEATVERQDRIARSTDETTAER